MWKNNIFLGSNVSIAMKANVHFYLFICMHMLYFFSDHGQIYNRIHWLTNMNDNKYSSVLTVISCLEYLRE
jgi:hypothetical protein